MNSIVSLSPSSTIRLANESIGHHKLWANLFYEANESFQETAPGTARTFDVLLESLSHQTKAYNLTRLVFGLRFTAWQLPNSSGSPD
jgi:hypothetical protein